MGMKLALVLASSVHLFVKKLNIFTLGQHFGISSCASVPSQGTHVVGGHYHIMLEYESDQQGASDGFYGFVAIHSPITPLSVDEMR